MKTITISAACLAIFAGLGVLLSSSADASAAPCVLVSGKAVCKPSGIRSIPPQPSPAKS